MSIKKLEALLPTNEELIEEGIEPKDEKLPSKENDPYWPTQEEVDH